MTDQLDRHTYTVCSYMSCHLPGKPCRSYPSCHLSPHSNDFSPTPTAPSVIRSRLSSNNAVYCYIKIYLFCIGLNAIHSTNYTPSILIKTCFKSNYTALHTYALDTYAQITLSTHRYLYPFLPRPRGMQSVHEQLFQLLRCSNIVYSHAGIDRIVPIASSNNRCSHFVKSLSTSHFVHVFNLMYSLVGLSESKLVLCLFFSLKTVSRLPFLNHDGFRSIGCMFMQKELARSSLIGSKLFYCSIHDFYQTFA